MTSQITEVRSKPFVILAITDAQREKNLSESKLQEITKTLEDMSLRFAKTYSSTIYVEEIESACKSVLGIVNLGLMFQSNKDLDKAKILLMQSNIMDFFRIGWTKIQELEKINPYPADALYKKFSLEANNSLNNDRLFEEIKSNFLSQFAMKQLDIKLVERYYDDSYNTVHTNGEIASKHICTIIVKSFLGRLSNSKGPLQKPELLDFVQLSFEFSRSELAEKISTDENVLSLVEQFSSDLKDAFSQLLEDFVQAQLFPLDELYNIREANPKYKPLEVACLYSGINSLDIANYVMSDITSEMSPAQRKKLNLGDDEMILE